MTTAQRLKTYLKMIAGGAAVATAMTLATPAVNAQVSLEPGDLVGVGGPHFDSNSSYDSWLWKIDPTTGSRTTIFRWDANSTSNSTDGVQYDYTYRPNDVVVGGDGFIYTTHGYDYSSVTGRIWKIDPNDPANNSGQLGSNIDWTQSPDGITWDYSRDSLIVVGSTQDSTSNSSSYDGRLWRVDPNTGARTELYRFDRDQNATDQNGNAIYTNYTGGTPTDVVMSQDGRTMWVTSNYDRNSSEGKIWKFEDLDGDDNWDATLFTNNWGWTEKPFRIDLLPNGNLLVGTAQADSTSSSYDGTLWEVDPDTGAPIQKLWDMNSLRSDYYNEITGLAYDSDNDQAYISYQYRSNSSNGYFGIIENTDTDTEFETGTELTSYSWTEKLQDLYYISPAGFTGLNDVVIGDFSGTDSNMTGDPDFRSSDASAELDIATLLTALGSGSAGVRPGWEGTNTGEGDVTLAVNLDTDNIGTQSLNLTATDDVILNGTIGDSDTGTAQDNLSLTLKAGNTKLTGAGSAPATQADVEINAALALGSGDLTASGDDITQAAGATIDTTGNVSMNAQDDLLLNDTVAAGNVTLVSNTSTTIESTVDAASFSSSGTGTLVINGAVTASGTATLNHDGTMTINEDFTADGLTVQGNGTFDASAVTLELGTGDLILEHSGATRLNVVNSGGFAITADQTVTSGDVTVGTLDLNNNELRIGGDAVVSADSVVNTAGGIQILGGTYSGAIGSYITLVSGTYALDGDLTLFPNSDLDQLGGVGTGATTAPVLNAGQELAVSGTTSLLKGMDLAGGTLTTGALEWAEQLNWTSGTVNLTASDLAVTDGGTFGDQIELSPDMELNITGADNTVTVAADGYVYIAGDANGGGKLNVTGSGNSALNNNGVIELDAPLAQVGGTTLNNAGTIKGSGRVMSSTVNNQAGGQINLTDGDVMTFGGSLTNSGSISFLNSDMTFAQTVTNNADGSLVGEDGIIRFADQTIQVVEFGGLADSVLAGMVNSGTMAFSGGENEPTEIFGTVATLDGGSITVTGGTLVTFANGFHLHDDDDVTGEGVLNVTGGSAVVFLGNVGGSGSITGQGSVFFEAGSEITPGQSPGELEIQGSLGMASGSTLEIEIGGLVAGESYDVLSIGGVAEIGGTLLVTNIDGYVAEEGDVFDILNAGLLIGEFDQVLFEGGAYDVDYSSSGVSLTAIPEPSSVLLLGSLLGLVARRRRRA